MSKRLWMPFYIADYLADTGHLTVSEHGAYMLLIMRYWQDGALPTDENLLMRYSRMSREQWTESRDVIATLFDDGWTHKRIDAELAKSEEIIAKKSMAGKARRNTNSTPDEHPLTPTPTQEQKKVSEEASDARKPALAPDEFDAFWSLFPNKVGKPKARQAFVKARSRASFEAIMAGLARYAAKTDDRLWLNPTTFLNQERWTDEPAAPRARGSPVERNPALFAARQLMEKLNAVPPSETQTDRTYPRLVAPGVG